MAKLLKGITEEVTGGQLATTIRDSANHIWLAGLGAFARAQSEGSKLFSSLVKEGQALQDRTGESLSEASTKASGLGERVETAIEESLAKVLHGFGAPTRRDIDGLNDRVTKLTKVVEKLAEAHEADMPAPKAAKAPKPEHHSPAAG